jgi:hypothetical protein
MNPPAGPDEIWPEIKAAHALSTFSCCLGGDKTTKARKKYFEASDEVFPAISFIKPQWLAGRLIPSGERASDDQGDEY